MLRLLCFLPLTLVAELIYDSKGFEDLAPRTVPPLWQAFHADSAPDVHVLHGGYESRRCVRAKRSESRGWTALSRRFPPQQRVVIDFSFAISASEGRTLNVWTHEPGGLDASQLNICHQNGALMQYDGSTRSWQVISTEVVPTRDAVKPVWHRLRILVDSQAQTLDFWLSQPHSRDLPAKPVSRLAYRSGLPIGALDLVSGTRIVQRGWYLIDNLRIEAGNLPAPSQPAQPTALWAGPPIPRDPRTIPEPDGLTHSLVHQAREDGYKFLHGAAIIAHDGVLYANWANSPTNENGPHEIMQGRRSTDGGKTWGDLEVIAPGFDSVERHSHGVLMRHQGQLWVFVARFGIGADGRRFDGLSAEAFVRNPQSDGWDSRGVVMRNCWPYDEPARLANGNFITGGQDKDGLPVVAISHGQDLTHWDSVLIPYEPALAPSFAETSVLAEGNHVTAVIRGGAGVAWISESEDGGRTWSRATRSNLPMPRAKAYFGKLSTGERFLVANLWNRDTLVLSTSAPGDRSLSRMWRIRHGKSGPPRFKGAAKSKQWSYPYAHEHDGKLYIVYSIGKEDCGLSIVPLESLRRDD